ncbi:cytochrome c3 family protein [Persicirhabdus sediminis]|uniref:Cytochrome c3 family protein n=1 Tax=Persicirhabdus sediminis TaxID=454144 RepID=A0A8J7SJW5_9BACT|nr:cytochrome c3 family protein [Persicirhabdus sediminis]MBK1790405.1 cytochrome c3 family protein [Persicirhabdus sediminis]
MANFFPRWSNLVPFQIAGSVACIALGVAAGFAYYATPKAQRVGYQPDQPIPFDHALHVTQNGIDCRYCHSFVEESGHANVPTADTCWKCHQHVQTENPKLEPLRAAVDESYAGYTGKPIEWVRIHKAPDYVYFDHSAHLNRGISCVSCHGQVDEMRKVWHDKSLSMDFCLECHRAPEKHLRPLEEVYNLKFDAAEYLAAHPELGIKVEAGEDAQLALGKALKEKWSIQPKESCFTCHR